MSLQLTPANELLYQQLNTACKGLGATISEVVVHSNYYGCQQQFVTCSVMRLASDLPYWEKKSFHVTVGNELVIVDTGFCNGVFYVHTTHPENPFSIHNLHSVLHLTAEQNADGAYIMHKMPRAIFDGTR